MRNHTNQIALRLEQFKLSLIEEENLDDLATNRIVDLRTKIINRLLCATDRNTIVVTAHSIEEVDRFEKDRIVIFDDGIDQMVLWHDACLRLT